MTAHLPNDPTEWIERMRRANLLDAASALGFAPELLRNPQKRGLPCPVCGAERRHTKTRDKRGAVGPRPDGKGWRCFQCDASGDVLDFVAAQRHGKRWRELGSSAKTEVRDWCLRWLGMSTLSSNYGDAVPRTRTSPIISSAETPPTYPPPNEIEAFWNRCVRVDEVPAVAAYLASTSIDAQIVADRDLARALHPDVSLSDLPSWTHRPLARNAMSSWAQDGRLLIVQQVDARGIVRSVLGRQVKATDSKAPKSLPPKGFERRGLVLACELGRQVLATGRRPEWWPDNQPLRIEVCEGEKKWLLRITRKPAELALRGDADECAPIVLGVVSGAWTNELAARIPDGSRLFVTPDANNAGAEYATKILQSMEARVNAGSVEVCIDERKHELFAKNGRRAVRVRGS